MNTLFSLPTILAQVSDDITTAAPQVNTTAALIGGVVYFGVILLLIISMWKIFTKAGQPGWASIVPIYNIYLLLKVAGKPGWWMVLMFIPFVNFIIFLLVALGLAEKFGRGAGFGIGLALLGFVFFPILAFGDAQYQGAPSAPGYSPVAV